MGLAGVDARSTRVLSFLSSSQQGRDETGCDFSRRRFDAGCDTHQDSSTRPAGFEFMERTADSISLTCFTVLCCSRNTWDLVDAATDAALIRRFSARRLLLPEADRLFMKCIVFGGGGFIGSAIVDRLLRDGHAIRIFERPRVEPYRKFEAHEQVEWMTGDLLSTHDVMDAVDGADVVFHLVSTTLPKSSNDDPIYDVQSNLVATLQMLNAMVAHKVPRMVFISSGGTVYGPPTYLPIDERHPTEPRVSYGITKLAIEK